MQAAKSDSCPSSGSYNLQTDGLGRAKQRIVTAYWAVSLSGPTSSTIA